jgi:hypothetical protein
MASSTGSEALLSRGWIKEIADYCESDVVNTYRVWLRYKLFRGKHTYGEFQASEANLTDFVKVLQ